MTPRTELEFERMRSERKNQIMETALELFAQVGYHQTTVGSIASQAGISKGLIYNYFESKEELLQAIISKGIDLFLHNFDKDKDGELTEEEFDYFVEGLFEILRTNHQFYKLYISILSQPEAFKLIKIKFKQMYQFFVHTLTSYFERTGARNPNAEAMLFSALVDGVLFHYLVMEDYPLEEIKKTIINRFKTENYD